jgi:hypothetical protein
MKLRELLAVTDEHVIVMDDFNGGLAPANLEKYGYLDREVTKIVVPKGFHDLAVYVHDPDND